MNEPCPFPELGTLVRIDLNLIEVIHGLPEGRSTVVQLKEIKPDPNEPGVSILVFGRPDTGWEGFLGTPR